MKKYIKHMALKIPYFKRVHGNIQIMRNQLEQQQAEIEKLHRQINIQNERTDLSANKKIIYAVTEIKDDSDIIESFCRHHMQFLDGLIICDDSSGDNTVQIVESLISEGMNIQLIHRRNYPKDRKISDHDFFNQMAEWAFENHKADIVLPINCDEFLIDKNGENPRYQLEKLDADKCYKIRRRNAIYENEPIDSTVFLPEYFTSYLDESYDTNGRSILTPHLYYKLGGKVGLGLHHVVFPPDNTNLPSTTECHVLIYAHYAVRSPAQYALKVTYGWLAFSLFNLGDAASHWKKAYELVKTNGYLTHEQTKELSLYMVKTYGIENPIIHKDSSKMLKYKDDILYTLRLHYTDYSIFKNNFWGYVLTAIEYLLSELTLASTDNDATQNENEAKEKTSYSCAAIQRFNMALSGQVDSNDAGIAFCCTELLANTPHSLFAKSAKESLENFTSLKNKIINGFVYDGCAKCVDWKKGEWNHSELIQSVNLSMYPSPCNYKCIYCGVDKNDNNAFLRPEVAEGYEKIFDLLEYAKKEGYISKTAGWQVSVGEITIHPYKEKILNLVKSEKVTFFTNCFKFDEDIGQNLRNNSSSGIMLSIDCGTPNTWHKIKGVNNFTTVINNLEKYLEYCSHSGQIIFKYIILPDINTSLEDYNGVINLMKKMDISNLIISRDARFKYNDNDVYMDNLIKSTVTLISILNENNLQYSLLHFSSSEITKIENAEN
ncbi:MAG: glycosyltransferase family 2 protein [Clostridiales bacterium]|nr:glycosyltransferase family 2 protein [Clostridiales bacterium]